MAIFGPIRKTHIVPPLDLRNSSVPSQMTSCANFMWIVEELDTNMHQRSIPDHPSATQPGTLLSVGSVVIQHEASLPGICIAARRSGFP